MWRSPLAIFIWLDVVAVVITGIWGAPEDRPFPFAAVTWTLLGAWLAYRASRGGVIAWVVLVVVTVIPSIGILFDPLGMYEILVVSLLVAQLMLLFSRPLRRQVRAGIQVTA